MIKKVTVKQFLLKKAKAYLRGTDNNFMAKMPY